MAECPYPSRVSLEVAMRWAARFAAADAYGRTQERGDEKEPQP